MLLQLGGGIIPDAEYLPFQSIELDILCDDFGIKGLAPAGRNSAFDSGQYDPQRDQLFHRDKVAMITVGIGRGGTGRSGPWPG
jgi:hypothetical protein